MASLTDFLSTSQGGQPLAWQYATMLPQYRVNDTLPNLQEDAAIGTSRALQDYSTRGLPDLMNQGAATGQTGSSGLRNRADRMTQDTGRNVTDIQRMLFRNTASIAQQKVMASMGGMF